jgi:hypothetical protein
MKNWNARDIKPRKCKLSEFGECELVFTPDKDWGQFCCVEHRKRWHYLDRTRTPFRKIEAVEDARHASVNGHANGHDVAKSKLTLADLGVAPAQPTTPPFKRRKLNNTQDAKEEIERGEPMNARNAVNQ